MFLSHLLPSGLSGSTRDKLSCKRKLKFWLMAHVSWLSVPLCYNYSFHLRYNDVSQVVVHEP